MHYKIKKKLAFSTKFLQIWTQQNKKKTIKEVEKKVKQM